MSRRKKELHRSALPLMRRITDGRFTKSGAARDLDVRPQDITNWLARGIPSAKVSDVAALCGISTDEYLFEAGMLSKRAKAKQGKLITTPHIEDFAALPDFLQAYISKKTRELRHGWDEIPTWLRETLAPPKDPAHYREWERDIEGLVLKFRGDGPDRGDPRK